MLTPTRLLRKVFFSNTTESSFSPQPCLLANEDITPYQVALKETPDTIVGLREAALELRSLDDWTQALYYSRFFLKAHR